MQTKPEFTLVQEENITNHEIVREALFGSVKAKILESVYDLFQQEVDALCGKSHDRSNEELLKRAGSEKGKIFFRGQPLKVKRPRVRSNRGEEKIESYEALKNYDFLSDDVLKKVIHGISTRDYSKVIDTWEDDLKLTKSSVSRAFVRASQKDLDEINSRDLSKSQFFAMMIDGIDISGLTIVVAMGFTCSGKKEILGLIEGGSENSELVKSLFQNLQDRGLSLTDEALFVLDGSKALRKAVKDSFGKRAIIQRCQVHKIRNVQSHMPKKYHGEIKRRMKTAYNMKDYLEALQILENTVLWLRQFNDSAANSLLEGMKETITVHRLNMPSKLRSTFSTTNPIESMFDKVKSKMRRVKNWKSNGKAARWSASSLLVHEKQFRTIKGFREIPLLLNSLKTLAIKLDKERRAA